MWWIFCFFMLMVWRRLSWWSCIVLLCILVFFWVILFGIRRFLILVFLVFIVSLMLLLIFCEVFLVMCCVVCVVSIMWVMWMWFMVLIFWVRMFFRRRSWVVNFWGSIRRLLLCWFRFFSKRFWSMLWIKGF